MRKFTLLFHLSTLLPFAVACGAEDHSSRVTAQPVAATAPETQAETSQAAGDGSGSTTWTIGVDGKNGVDGKDGLNGTAGKDGTPGKDGPPGPKGDRGTPGQAGTPGEDGVNGLPGADGQDGETSTAPRLVAASTGEYVGDMIAYVSVTYQIVNGPLRFMVSGGYLYNNFPLYYDGPNCTGEVRANGSAGEQWTNLFLDDVGNGWRKTSEHVIGSYTWVSTRLASNGTCNPGGNTQVGNWRKVVPTAIPFTYPFGWLEVEDP